LKFFSHVAGIRIAQADPTQSWIDPAKDVFYILLIQRGDVEKLLSENQIWSLTSRASAFFRENLIPYKVSKSGKFIRLLDCPENLQDSTR
jgi:hypothetical protein